MGLEKGLIQVYTGDGKGKTTAALGQAVRAVGEGLKVYMVQFLKTDDTGELNTVKKLHPDFQIFRFERKRGFFWTLNESEKAELREDVDKAIDFCKEVMDNNECDILILDEIMAVMTNGIVPVGIVVNMLESKPANMEIILTGRNAPPEISDIADLVTEMKEVKHYFRKGIPQRKGIEF